MQPGIEVLVQGPTLRGGTAAQATVAGVSVLWGKRECEAEALGVGAGGGPQRWEVEVGGSCVHRTESCRWGSHQHPEVLALPQAVELQA